MRRFAALAQAMRSTIPTAPRSTRSIWRLAPTISCVERNDEHLPSRVAIGMLAAELRHDCVHFRSACAALTPVFKPPDAFDVVRAALVRISIEGEGPPYIHVSAICDGVVFIAGVLGSGRHDADDGERLHVHCDLAADDVGRRAEARAPQAIADDHLQAIAGNLRLESNSRPSSGREAEHTEVAEVIPKPLSRTGSPSPESWTSPRVKAAMDSKDWFRARKSRKSQGLRGNLGEFRAREKDAYEAVRLGIGQALESTPLMTLKMALLAPMLRARVSIMTMEKVGFARNCRTA